MRKNLHISKICCTFAPDLENKPTIRRGGNPKQRQKVMKTIHDNQAVRLSNWNENSAHEAAMIHDMGLNPDYAEYVTDEDRLYASARPSFLTNDPDWYASEDEAYKNIITLEDGELVKLASNGKTYRVKAMRKRFEYLTDILHFILVA